MFTLMSNRNLRYEYAKALQVCDLLSNWVHPSQMPAFTSKDKWRLEVSENKKKKRKKNWWREVFWDIQRAKKNLYFGSESAIFV